MSWASLGIAGASAAGNKGSITDERVGGGVDENMINDKEDMFHSIQSGSLFFSKKGLENDPRGWVEKVLDPGALFLKGKPKFREFIPKSLSALVGEAQDAFTQQAQQKMFQSQIDAQRSTFQPFFDRQAQVLKQGDSLLDKLTTGDLERRLTTQSIRGAQAARGLSLGPAAAIQEGLEVARAQREAETAALGLGQSLAQFSASTPQPLQQLNFNQLLAQAGQIDLARGGFQTDAQISNINLERDQNTQNMALLGRGLSNMDFGKMFGKQGNTTTNVNVQTPLQNSISQPRTGPSTFGVETTQGQGFGNFSNNQTNRLPGDTFTNFSQI